MIILNPLRVAIGGLVLGTASFYYRFFWGRVLGISGFINSHEETFKMIFIAGLAAAGVSASTLFPDIHLGVTETPWYLPVAGFLVGFGTRLGNGCTSGHGLCGLARFSKRSLAAVLTFMASGMLTRFLTLPSYTTDGFHIKVMDFDYLSAGLPLVSILMCVGSYLLSLAKSSVQENKTHLTVASLLWGLVFGFGLILTEMTSQLRVYDFLSFPTLFFEELPLFDPSLAIVMGAGLIPSLYGHFTLEDLKKPFLSLKSYISDRNAPITGKLLIGASIFGAGWGLGGICPGPAIVLLGNEFATGQIFTGAMGSWIVSYLIGSRVASLF